MSSSKQALRRCFIPSLPLIFILRDLVDYGLPGSETLTLARTRIIGRTAPGSNEGEHSLASEYPAANIAVFRSHESPISFHQNMSRRGSHWAEVDGGLHSIEYITEQQKLALARLSTSYYVLKLVRGQ